MDTSKKDTCQPRSCYFFELLANREQCPNYLENWFYPPEGEPYLVKDCAPKRQVDILKDIHTEVIRLSKILNEQVNSLDRTKETYKGLASLMSKFTPLSIEVDYDSSGRKDTLSLTEKPEV